LASACVERLDAFVAGFRGPPCWPLCWLPSDGAVLDVGELPDSEAELGRRVLTGMRECPGLLRAGGWAGASGGARRREDLAARAD
jgi:hypothetical protein